MAFTPEDGTGLSGANSLTTVEYADAYFEERGVSAWTGSDSLKEQALVRATDYIETRWGQRNKFRGTAQFPDAQALSFPRLYIGSDDAVPVAVQKATCEYALRALTSALAPDPTVSAGPQLESVREKVGPLETETRYQQGAMVLLFKPYPMADMLLQPYTLGAGLVRA